MSVEQLTNTVNNENIRTKLISIRMRGVLRRGLGVLAQPFSTELSFDGLLEPEVAHVHKGSLLRPELENQVFLPGMSRSPFETVSSRRRR
jgi:hypothetical protein